MQHKKFDIAIAGGGIGGLSLALKLCQLGYDVILFEKETYPFHKVCGEYISMESWNYLESLGLPLSSMGLPLIRKLNITSPGGKILKATLPLGGFGVSRYFIDDQLSRLAIQKGICILQDCKVEDIIYTDDSFKIQTSSGDFTASVCCGSFGKRSNLDVKWKRHFITTRRNRLNNYIGVKYHIKISAEEDTISLHNFKNGYCGISRIEGNNYCLCYLTTADNLQQCGNSIQVMERNILSRNPYLRKIFENASIINERPVTISQISFNPKSQVHNHVLLTGDAAGMITPLCGNGMSMAMHAGKIAAGVINEFLQNKISRSQMESNYTRDWNKAFSKRLLTGRIIQRFFGKVWLSEIFIATIKISPWLTGKIIRLTHGRPF